MGGFHAWVLANVFQWLTRVDRGHLTDDVGFVIGLPVSSWIQNKLLGLKCQKKVLKKYFFENFFSVSYQVEDALSSHIGRFFDH